MCDTCGCGQNQDPVAVPTDQPQTIPAEPVVPPTTEETPVAPAESNPAPEAPAETPAEQPVGETTPVL
ncbi:MAG: hypothetical protein ACOX50_02575 [Patescibacteria group bacterium]|jgi:hypothetical protein